MATATLEYPQEWIRQHQSGPPVNVRKLAENLGLLVFELSDLPSDISGKLYRDFRSPSGWSIGVNRNESYTRKRFTIAHEIAHFLLHRPILRDGVTDDVLYRSAYLSGTQETEANKMAADILMPYHLLQKTALGGPMDVDALAKKFGVSAQAMSIRLGIPLP